MREIKGGPIVGWLVMYLRVNNTPEKTFCVSNGFSEDVILRWKSGRAMPKLFTIQCMLDALGYELKVVKKEPAV